MHPQIEAIFDEAENRYLKADELTFLSQYVDSLPERLETYRSLRDQEIAIMQKVADQLQAELPQANVPDLERSIKNALLVMRYSAMAMLLNDETLMKDRLLNWLSRTVQGYNTQAIDTVLYRLLNQTLTQMFSAKQMSLLTPSLKLAQDTLLAPSVPA